MQLSATIDYAADPQSVFAMLADHEFQERKCAATGALNSYVDILASESETTITTKRTLSTQTFPDFVRSLVGDTILVTQADVWGPAEADGTRVGTIAVTVEGAPITLAGTLRLAATGTGTTESVDAELRCTMPFVGGKIEKAAAPAVQSALRAEKDVGARWLAGDR